MRKERAFLVGVEYRTRSRASSGKAGKSSKSGKPSTTGGLTAGAAVLSYVGFKGLTPCREGEEEGRQPPHQSEHGCFALHVGGMDIFWRRQFSGCHRIYDAPLLSALHEGMLNFLVCLSSYRYGKYAFDVEAARTRVGLRPLKL